METIRKRQLEFFWSCSEKKKLEITGKIEGKEQVATKKEMYR